MEESKLALEITKGFRGVVQDLVTPDLKAIVAVLNQHSTILQEHGTILKEHGHTLKELNGRLSRVEANQERDHELLKTMDGRLWELNNKVADIHQKTVELTNKVADTHQKTVELTNKVADTHQKTVELGVVVSEIARQLKK